MLNWVQLIKLVEICASTKHGKKPELARPESGCSSVALAAVAGTHFSKLTLSSCTRTEFRSSGWQFVSMLLLEGVDDEDKIANSISQR